MYGVKLRSFILVFSDKTNSHSLGPQKLIYSNLTEFCKINKKNYTNISKFTVIDSDSPQVALAPPPPYFFVYLFVFNHCGTCLSMKSVGVVHGGKHN